ncbi:hypothetical protein IV494_08100 [Kaistella sp. G5-32]|uniref:PD-(D/E)XK nuclease superfamily protein n=1 Tax=Kaistella gelatinilytica TaxID=2787636 RepID=A0ABS0FBR6_9FLAO|nr:hypothetical protein [Kaistella gelatinilytica]MBF8457144.1 hypothetical protein [Kaistella gelatinilytica]
MEQILDTLFHDASIIFLQADLQNILNDVNERNLCGRLAIHLNDKLKDINLPGYFVDPEYNRNRNGSLKTILNDEFNEITINCDIIIHSRGHNKKADNLIAIEMKKSNRSDDHKKSDKNRLKALTKISYDEIWSNDGKTLPIYVCGYAVGYYMELDIKNRICLIEVYKKGDKTKEWRQEF